ncbi:endonuclease/exonuclease/phosphatase family protein [Opitutus terrae]|uniref:Endonuclease/exonuclease/phosphatase n=1 Tax=Opitutus terrae (strain DSM 11246 / JCM 15787 / PB90-1) TaxID=452637 RepID=B1ZVI2_OPITP|nr:endonuclease/exonuclease/phosphatase family protein [Opitutus terrae]ACB74079.1 Endonuclease/exonuclease/phosphatase [Opitutus terrae PB90-1]
MFAGIESIVHRLRLGLSRNEWAIRHLGLTPSEGTSEVPGLLLIQIDGLARSQVEAALAAGRLPFLRRLLEREGYELRTFYPGLPSTTPAVQAELFYGVKSAVPAFSFFDRVLKKMGRMWDPDWAKARESACMQQAEGLLKGGSSWSNIYTGGAAQEESHFCAASIGLGDMWRSGKIRNIFLFIIFQLPAALRIFWLLLIEMAVSVGDGVRAIAAGRRPSPEIMLMLSRVFIGVGLRELLTISGEIDVTRGLPIVHINFVGYDEQAHVRGPGSRFAHFGLRGIDTAIRKITRAAHRSRRRDYAVWIFSDHGQEHTRSILDVVPGGIEQVISESLEQTRRNDPVWQQRQRPRRTAAAPWLTQRRRLTPPSREERAALDDQGRGFVVAAMGPVAHVYFTEPKTDDQRRALARTLVRSGHVPGVLLRDAAGEITWFHAQGETRVPGEVPALLPHPPTLREEIARDLVGFTAHPDAGDLILVGWSPWDAPVSFAPERGAHGGFGPNETQGFALLPSTTELPAGTDDFIRPGALRTAALHYLGRHSLAARSQRLAPAANRLRLMTYNVHGCSGMDGRVSPRRVARVIAAHGPDLVALQEIDLGRRRSRAEDQAALIAHQLGLHMVFCPTVTRGQEHYGHALLSRWPIEVVKRKLLPHDPRGWWKEPRAALWARVWIGDTPVHVVTTHLGLGRRERLLQMKMLLSPEWLGGLRDDERVVLCGDFNLTPGSAPYGLMANRLQDAQAARDGHRPLSTFSSNRPFVRLDHIFISPHFRVQDVRVPRSELTRVASDHLPLIVDLALAPAAAETPTRTSP